MQRADAVQLISVAAQVARDARSDGCAAQREIATLQTRSAALLASGRVPIALRAPLRSGVEALVRVQPACTRPAAVVAHPEPKPPKHEHKPKPPKPDKHHGKKH